ncbi:MAG: sugar ABC transporter ATP-binding protein [Beutenbergiaceae bacterium]
MDTPVLEMVGITKTFPGVNALSGVDLTVAAGEVHCLLGQNGAGKSTLIKTLAGAYLPDSGDIVIEGAVRRFRNPADAANSGVATMYQELDLVDWLTVAENIFLGRELSTAGVSRRSAANRQAADLLERLGHADIGATEFVGRLSPAGKQIVSMARALSRDARIIVMDEPSAVLSQDEVDNLFRVIRDLRADGVAVIYISHRLEEIREIGDRITVLKDGMTVAMNLDARQTSTDEIVTLMSGRQVDRLQARTRTHVRSAEPVLDVVDLSRGHEFADVSFQVHGGEVVGLAGLVGSGRSEILETIYGARKADGGLVAVNGKRLRSGIRAAIQAGIGLAPEERKSQALVLREPTARNMLLASLRQISALGWLRRDREQEIGRSYVDRMDVRPPDPRAAARNLSGGNQQKVVLARWLIHGCSVLLLDEPTRGVDVAARAEIYRMIDELAEQGIAIVVVSSELDEVIKLSDRVLVVREGRVIDERQALEITEEEVLDMVMEGGATMERDEVTT